MKVVGRSAFVFVVLCLSITIASGQVRQSRFAYVVTSSGNIAGYTINATTGALTPVPGSPFANGYANSITVDPTGRFAFVAQTNSSMYTQTTGGVSAYKIDPSNGSLSLVAGSPYLAATCCLSGSSASVDPTGKFLYVVEGVVNYAELWGFAIDPVSGALSPISGSPYAVGYELSLPTIDPAGKFIYVEQGLGIDINLLGFAIDPMTGGLIPVPGSPYPGSSFNPITIGPKGKFVYTVDPIAGVSAFDIDSTTGSLTLAPGSPFSTPVGISVTLDPADRFAYALNNNCGYPPDGSVTGFTIDPSTGSLSEISTFPAGGCPQVLVMDPTGRFVYVVQQSGILGYTIDPSTGVLNPVSGSLFPGSYLSGLTIDSPGKFLYSANRAAWANLPDDPYVYGFSIDPTTGVLTAIPGSPFPTGSTPIAPVVLTAGPPPVISGPWTHFSLSGSGPSLNGTPVVYDPASNRLIVFGSCTNSQCTAVDNGTWVLTNANGIGGTPQWQQLAPTGTLPPGRISYSAVYDQTNNRIVIFGGGVLATVGGFAVRFNDVWALSNANGLGGTPSWTELVPAGGPPNPRESHRAVYDSTTNRMTIFGGGNDGIMDVPNDTWVLTNANGLTGAPQWIQLSPTGTLPAPREVFVSTYDPAANAMTVFGGCCPFMDDLWILADANGVGSPAWQQVTQGLPAPGTLANWNYGYDASTSSLIFFGGSASFGTFRNDLWVLENANGIGTPTWTNPIPNNATGSPPAGAPIGTYDPVRQRYMIVPDTADLWVLDVSGFLGTSGSGSHPATHTLTVSSTNPTSSVPVIVNPSDNNGIGNGTTQFALTYNDGALVTLSAAASAGGNNLSGWTGCDSTSGANCTVTMSSDRTVTAEYATPSFPQPIAGTGSTSGATGSSGPTASGSNTNDQLSSAEPVSTGNGNYFYVHADITLPGRGMPVVFERSYNTLDDYTGPLGANWTHSYNILLAVSAVGATVKWGDGHGETYTLNGANYVPQPGVFNTLVKNADGTFTLTRKDQTKFNFSATGKLTSIQGKNGNTVQLTYDTNGNLAQITDTIGRNLNFTYDASNRITQIADPLGRTVAYQYGASGNLTQSTDPAGGVTTYAYDSNHRVTSITQPNGQTLLQNTYDVSGRVVSQAGGRGFTWTFAYDTPNPGDTTITDARGGKAIHGYDSSLRIVRITDAAGGTTSFTYDAMNDRMSVTNQNGKTTNFAYDLQGNVTGITDPLTDTVSFAYDAKNDLTSATNAKGKTTLFTYDANGNLVQIQDALGNITKFSYDNFGELVSKTDAKSNTTAFSYDASGNLTGILDALSHKTTLAYDGIGRLTSITDPNGNAAAATYDSLSRLVKIADPLGNQTQFAYDAIGNLLKITDANGNPTSYAYDATNNLVAVTDAVGHVTKYGYDEDNNRTNFTNAKRNATSYAYDAVNRLTSITDPLSFVTAYTYDAVGNVLAVKDAKGQTNQFTYDTLNRLLGIAYADGKTVAYTYDANGNRTSMADSHGTTAYAYDALDRLVSVTHPGGKVVVYSYDAVGNRQSLTYPDGKVATYGYDAANKLNSVTDWQGNATTYSYDPASNLVKTAYPNGASITFSYDAANRVIRVVNATKNLPLLNLTYTLDNVGNRTSLSIDGVTTNYAYDPLNELVSAQLGILKSTWTYDAVGNRLSQSMPLVKTNYSYDADDRLLKAGLATFAYDANGNQVSVSKNAQGLPASYQFDAANRMIAATVGQLKNTYAYDGDGNRVSQSVGNGTYNYLNDVATALPVALQESGPDGNISYAYGLGLVSESGPTFNYYYHYDGLGSVVGLTDAAGKAAAAYAYDAWGNALLSIPDSVGTKNKFRFTGEALDPGTQLYYLRARYYDPSVGRFISRDPVAGFVTRPSTLHHFLYAMNNPVLLSDPLGLSPSESAQNSFVTDPRSWIMEGFSLSAQQAVQWLVRPLAVDLNFAPSIAGAASAYTNTFLSPVLSVVQSIEDARSHPERGILEDFQRGSIDFAVNTIFTVGAILGGPGTATAFTLESGVYDVNRENIQNTILDEFGGWLQPTVDKVGGWLQPVGGWFSNLFTAPRAF